MTDTTKIILQTERLYLRKLTPSDFPALCRIMQDEKTMYAYEGAFSDKEVQDWLENQLLRYKKHGFGLWAVVLKETDRMIGQCGLTMQKWKESELLEIGYLFEREYWHKGYATEAALACKKYAFENLKCRRSLFNNPRHKHCIPKCCPSKRHEKNRHLDKTLPQYRHAPLSFYSQKIIMAAFARFQDSPAKTRLFGVPLPLHSSAA